jgi:hypothetical protein
VKRLLAVLVGGFGLRALLRRRRRQAELGSPAAQLRAKLDESRSVVAEPEVAPPPAAPEPEPDPAPAAEQDVDDRRASVHEQARRAIDELGS